MSVLGSIGTPSAIVIFSEVSVTTPGVPIALDSDMETWIPGMPNQVRMRITTNGELGFNILKGSVIIYDASDIGKDRMIFFC